MAKKKRKSTSTGRSGAAGRPVPSKAIQAAKPRRKPRIATTALRGLKPTELGIKRMEREAARRQIRSLLGAQARRKPQQEPPVQSFAPLVNPRDPFDLCAKHRKRQAIRKGAILAAGKGGKGNLHKGLKKHRNPC
ncbi:hypothetical protein [Microviridae sp.]|nr:hypothetical protein [Microviridae sp.]